MQKFAIFDFDGTITNLSVDWNLVRKALSISRISDIWSLSDIEKAKAFEIVSKHEFMGLNDQLNFHSKKFKRFSHFSILTNNSEAVVENFFAVFNSKNSNAIISPVLVVGRETLCAPKENESVFQNGINLILSTMHVTAPRKCMYVGDQEYELTHARRFGLEAIHIKDF